MSFVSNGRYCWTDLFTTNFEGAQNFYSKAFGWNIEKSPEMPNYAFAKDGDQMICGFSIADAGEASKHGLRDTFWGTYFYADNFDGTFERAKELGATVVFPKTPVANFGHFASFKDPSGSFFQIWNSADSGFKD
mgnify:FL=1